MSVPHFRDCFFPPKHFFQFFNITALMTEQHPLVLVPLLAL